MLELIEILPNTWAFHQDMPDGVEERLNEAVECFEAGDLDEAEEILREVLLVCPHHIDALHHLALIFSDSGLKLESYLCTREAVRIGLEAIPSHFSWLTSRMLWLELENRPFMRAYHALGLSILDSQGAASAIEVFARLLSVNRSDNLGCRYTLMQCYLDLNEWQAALDLSQRYNNDTGPDIVYSKVVALFQLDQDDENDEAIEALTFAIDHYPNIAKELIKTKHSEPESKHPGYITLGGEDEAYDYWERNRKHWTSDTIAYKTLKTLLNN